MPARSPALAPLHAPAEALRFDHHQRGFGEVFGHGFSTKLSSAGLVYKHFGREIVASAMQLPADHPDVQVGAKGFLRYSQRSVRVAALQLVVTLRCCWRALGAQECGAAVQLLADPLGCAGERRSFTLLPLWARVPRGGDRGVPTSGRTNPCEPCCALVTCRRCGCRSTARSWRPWMPLTTVRPCSSQCLLSLLSDSDSVCCCC